MPSCLRKRLQDCLSDQEKRNNFLDPCRSRQRKKKKKRGEEIDGQQHTAKSLIPRTKPKNLYKNKTSAQTPLLVEPRSSSASRPIGPPRPFDRRRSTGEEASSIQKSPAPSPTRTTPLPPPLRYSRGCRSRSRGGSASPELEEEVVGYAHRRRPASRSNRGAPGLGEEPGATLTGDRSAAAAVGCCSKEHQRIYADWFSLADPDGDGRVTGADATKFFAMSGLPRADLKQVWAIADSKRQGYLGFGEFAAAMQLVSLAQAGNEITQDSLKREDLGSLDPPLMKGVDELLARSKAKANDTPHVQASFTNHWFSSKSAKKVPCHSNCPNKGPLVAALFG